MAVIAHSATNPTEGMQYIEVLWETIGNGDTGAPIRIPEWSDKTVTFTATWGVGGSVTLQGSISDNPLSATWFTLVEPDNTTNITTTADALFVLLANPLWIRPSCTAGDGTTDIDCRIVAVSKLAR